MIPSPQIKIRKKYFHSFEESSMPQRNWIHSLKPYLSINVSGKTSFSSHKHAQISLWGNPAKLKRFSVSSLLIFPDQMEQSGIFLSAVTSLWSSLRNYLVKALLLTNQKGLLVITAFFFLIYILIFFKWVFSQWSVPTVI